MKMALQIAGTTVINNNKGLENITNLKTVAGQSILGSGDIAIAAGGGDYIMRTYTGPATWTKPADLKAVKVTVVGGGGGGSGARACESDNSRTGRQGGSGGASVEYIPANSIPGPVAVTVGVGGAGGPAPGTICSYTAGGSGGASSFGSFLSATGGTGGGGAGGPAFSGTGPAGVDGAGSGGDINVTGMGIYGLIAFPSATSSPNTAGVPGNNIGAAGSGGRSTTTPAPRAGGAGVSGIVLVEEFY
jgi:hypothetical protein